MGTDKGFNYQCGTGEVYIPPPPRLGSAMKHLDDIFHIDLPLPPLQLAPHLPAPSIEFPVGLRAVSISLYPSTEVVRLLPPLFSRADNSNQGWGWWCRWRGWRWGWWKGWWGWRQDGGGANGVINTPDEDLSHLSLACPWLAAAHIVWDISLRVCDTRINMNTHAHS